MTTASGDPGLSRRVILAAATIAIVGAALHLSYMRRGLRATPDSPLYLATAANLAAGRGFLNAAGDCETMRTPGYPLFLALFPGAGVHSGGVILVQHLLVVLLSVLPLLLASRLGISQATALFAGSLIGIDTATIVWSNQVMSESLSLVTVFVTAVFAIFEVRARGHVWYSLLAGLFAAAATLVRPVAILWWVPLGLVILAASKRHRAAAVAAFLIPALGIPGAWALRNRACSGVTTVTSIAGESMLFWRAAGAAAMQQTGFVYSPLPDETEGEFRRLVFRDQPRLRQIAEGELAAEHGDRRPALPHAVVARKFREVGSQIVAENTRGFIGSTVNGALHTMFDGSWEYGDATASAFTRPLLFASMFAALLAQWLLAAAGVLSLWKRDRYVASLLVFSSLYFVLVSAGPEASSRLRVPFMPLLALLTAQGAVAIYETFRQRRMPIDT